MIISVGFGGCTLWILLGLFSMLYQVVAEAGGSFTHMLGGAANQTISLWLLQWPTVSYGVVAGLQ